MTNLQFMSSGNFKATQSKTTITVGKNVKSVSLTLEIECTKTDFAWSVERAAKLLKETDLQDVKEISIKLKSTD